MAVLQGVRGLLQRRGMPQLPLRPDSNKPSPEGQEGLEQYDLKELIGRGSSGRVFRAVRKADQLQVAIKLMGEEAVATHREFEIMQAISHPNLIRALDFFQYNCGAALVLTYVPGGTLTQAVKEGAGFLAEGKAKHLFRLLLEAVSYLHQHRIVHSDVKSDNVLISPDLATLHLTDFGSSRTLRAGDQPLTSTTIDFSAPEVLAGEEPTEKHDVWGAGLCLYYMLTGRLPRSIIRFTCFEDFCDAVQSSAISCSGPHWRAVSDDCKATVRYCLALEKGQRPAAMVILQMSWLRRGDEALRRASAPARPQRRVPLTSSGGEMAPEGEPGEHGAGAMSIDTGSFRNSKAVFAKLLPVRESFQLKDVNTVKASLGVS